MFMRKKFGTKYVKYICQKNSLFNGYKQIGRLTVRWLQSWQIVLAVDIDTKKKVKRITREESCKSTNNAHKRI